VVVQAAVSGPVPGEVRQPAVLLSTLGEQRLHGRGGDPVAGTHVHPMQEAGVPRLGHGR
jgi:hypothetical protein